jgi:hypothetical protein
VNSYSLSALKLEREELQKDLRAFKTAYDAVCGRMLESNDLERPRRPLLHEWSGSRAVVGSLELSIHAIERTLQGTSEIIYAIENGEIDNSDKPGHPGLGVVDGGKK